MRHINGLSLSLETSNLAFCKYASKYLTGQRRVEFLIKSVFPYLLIFVRFSKCLCKVSLNKGMLKCKTFILTLSKHTCTYRRVLLQLHTTRIYLSMQTLIHSSKMFSFQCHNSHKLTHPSRHYFSVVACTDQTVHMDVFLPPTQPTQDNMSIQTGIYFPLSQPTQANSSTRTSTFHRHLPHKLTCTHRCFLVSGTAFTGQPGHMGIFFSLTWHTQVFSSTQTLSNFCHGLHRPICPRRHFIFTDVAHTGLLNHTDLFQPLS